MPTILIADDDPHIRDVVHYALARQGHAVIACADGAAALARARAGGVDLLVLDVLMPELDGLAVCRALRAGGANAPPIVYLSSRGEEVDRILGLELGGDDYLPKPFSPRELATRVDVVLRRAGAHGQDRPPRLAWGPLEMSVDRHEVRAGGVVVELTVTEFAVLRALLERPGRLHTRAELIARAYPHDHHITMRTIDTHVRRIRAKLRAHGLDPVETVHGLGYRTADGGGAR